MSYTIFLFRKKVFLKSGKKKDLRYRHSTLEGLHLFQKKEKQIFKDVKMKRRGEIQTNVTENTDFFETQ